MSRIPKDVLRPYRDRDREAYRAPRGRIAADAMAGMAQPENTRGVAAMVLEMSEDYQVKFGCLVLDANIKAVPVTVSAESGDKRATALADQLTKLWKRTITRMCEAIPYGRVAFEKVSEFDQKSFLTFYSLDDLPFKETTLVLTEGRFDGIDLTAKGGTVRIPCEQSWWLAIDPETMHPHGKSRFAGAARKAYLDRKESRRLRALFLQRFAIGWAKAHVESRYKDPETGEMIDGHAKMQQAYDAMRSAGLMTFDNARIVKNDGSEGEYKDDIEALPVPSSAAPLDETLDGLDVEQLRALGIPEKTVTEGESVGSFAMVSQQMRVLMAVVDDLVGQMVDSFQKYVVDKAVAENWPPEDRPTLTVSYPPLTEGPTSLVFEIAKSILTGQPNPIILSGGVDVPEILRKSGVPLTPEMDEIWADPERRAALLPAAPVAPAPGLGLNMHQRGKGLFAAGNGGFDLREQDPQGGGDASFLSEVPSRRQVMEDGLDALQDLYAQMAEALSVRSVERFKLISDQVKSLRARIAVAANLIGMLSPWRPRLIAVPPGNKPTKALHLALDLSGFDFPWLRSAVHFLNSKELMSDEDFALLDRDERARALSVEGVDDREILSSVQDALVESLKSGEALPKFRKRIDEIIALPKAQTETLFRTQTKQAFLAGQERALSNPIVAEEFPYVEYLATDDTRVRDSHWELDGMIVRRGSPEHQLMLRALSDYNCRCTIRPVTLAEAEQRGIASLKDLGSTAREEYQSP